MLTKNFKTFLCCAVALLLSAGAAMAQQRVSGVIKDDAGEPLIGVNILVEGTGLGTVTDADGAFQLEVPGPESVLQISYTGYVAQEITVGTQSVIDVTMGEDVVGLEEVVVVGYGTVKKKDLTGAVSQIDAEKLETEATANITDLLRANVPGLNVGFNTSAKGISSAENLEVRGSTNVRGAAANAPLIVVDGMIYSGDLADINPNDIATFDILKDASSAAIYGSRASNGVIIITTKKGKKGRPTINVSSSIGLATLSGARYDALNGPQFIDWRIAGFEANERHQLDGSGKPGYYDDPSKLPNGVSVDQWKAYDGSSGASDLTSIWLTRLGFSPVEIDNYKAGNTIDWADYEFQNGLRNDHNISVSGSTDNLSYYWSLGYVNNEGFVYNEKYQAYRSRLNLETKVADFLKVGLNTQFAVKDQSPVASSTDLLNVTPYSAFYQEDGTTITYAPSGNISASRHPWLDLVYRSQYYQLNSLASKLYATVDLPAGFSITSEFIPRVGWDVQYQHWSSDHPEWKNEGGRAERLNTNVYEWQINNILKWSKEFGDHGLDFTFVQNAEKYQSWYQQIRRNNFQPSDILGYHQLGAATQDVAITNTDTYSTGDALLARLNYTFASKYLITGSFRRDGYSAFGQSNPHANFGSIALGWVLSEENFFNVSWLDLLKLRLSYGTNGNRFLQSDIGGNYAALSDLATGRYVQVINGQPQYVSQLYSNRLANAALRWERTGAYNFGVDFSAINGRVSGNLEVYYMQTKDLLIARSLPDVTGYSSVTTNLGQVDNRGFEITVNTVNVHTKDLEWRTGFALAHNRNEIVHLYGDMVDVKDANGNVIGQKEADDITNKWFIGHALDQIWDYNVLGIWQESEADEAQKYSREPGDFKLEDRNGDGLYTNDDKIFQGYTKPQFRINLRNDIQFRNWDLSVKLYSYLGYYSINNHKKNNDVFYDRGTSFNAPYWTPENPSNEWARVESFETGFDVYEQNSFIRLDNIALSYEVPSSALKRIGLQRLRLSAIAQNPYVWSPQWSWMDPENQGYTPTYYTFKINLTL